MVVQTRTTTWAAWKTANERRPGMKGIHYQQRILKEKKLMSNVELPALRPLGGAFPFGDRLLRVYGSREEPWFVNNEVCAILGHTNPRRAAASLDSDEKKVSLVVTPKRGAQSTTLINESGLYALIMKSCTPQAEQFQRWVTKEVLPAIRKYGSYVMPGPEEEFLAKSRVDDAIARIITNPRDAASAFRRICNALAEDQEDVVLERAGACRHRTLEEFLDDPDAIIEAATQMKNERKARARARASIDQIGVAEALVEREAM